VTTEVGDLDARLDLLGGRVDSALASAHTRSPAAPHTTGTATAELEALTVELRAAESSARLQAQRSQSLEDRVATLEAELRAARQRQHEAEALAEAARAEAVPASTPPEQPQGGPIATGPDRGGAELTQTLQAKLLEVERLTSELTALRRSNDEWRTRARGFRRELDTITGKHDKAAASLRELEQREARASKRVAELERLVAEQARELETAERRAKHLREHMRSS
jgi:chromosome segregation ATPase